MKSSDPQRTMLRLLAEPLFDRISALEARAVAAETDRETLRSTLKSISKLGQILRRLLLQRLRDQMRRVMGFGGGDSTEEAAFSSDSARATLAAISTPSALWRAKQRGVAIGTVIDVGAANGSWSASCERCFPAAWYLLLEPNEAHRPALERYCLSHRRSKFVIAAAGSGLRELWFEPSSDPYGGRVRTEAGAGWRKVAGTTLDQEIGEHRLPAPYLVRLNTHGSELPILKGANRVLRDTRLVVIEAYFFWVKQGGLVFHELVQWMWSQGFIVVDASEPVWRPMDDWIWRVELLFAPKDRA